ncbi:MAG: M1 family peptidase [Gemmatimonadetes bacterium]|nr:MAG: M1 family peptidase [Gemmatimonadota bacterium]
MRTWRTWLAVGAALSVWPGVGAAQENPFQQGVSYQIEAVLDEDAQVLHGRARVSYTNHSPDALDALYFHLYLNAFRPGSTWARVEQRRQYDFASLEDPDYAYERLTSVRVDGAEVSLAYPHAPDSTVVRLDLPAPLAPGETAVVDLDWDARPSTLCRRQCRQGRHWDLAQWYPRVAVYDRGGWQAHPLYPQGEFYGEFATYDVALDVADDQVIGATGVAVRGDPGWRPSPWSPERQVDYQRGWYGPRPPLEDLGLFAAVPPPGRKRVRFHAEDVHHFAWTASPDYRYEQVHHGDVVVRVLYRPGDLDWDLGAAARRTVRALEWLEGVFGPYPYPQLTNVHRLESGGTEFPMMIMDGGPGQGLITHETAHQYAHGILANNEWREAWLDEGMATFLTNWFSEEVGGVEDVWTRTVRGLADLERQNREYAVDRPSEDFPSFGVYGAMAYSKPGVVLRMLREYVRPDVMRRILATYYERFRFRHVTGVDFQAVAEEVAGEELGWFFDQWIRSTAMLDYAVTGAELEDIGGGRYRITVTVTRTGEAWMPVVLQVGEERRTLTSREATQTVVVETEGIPDEVVLDPDAVLLDANPDNNRHPVG